MKTKYSCSAGFSAIELLVTLFVASALVLAFYQLFIVIEEGNANAKNSAIASDLASSNLSKYPAIPAGRTCSNTTSYELINTTEAKKMGLTGSVTEKVTISFPYGCTNEDVAKIESSVTYGPNSARKTAVQATYVN